MTLIRTVVFPRLMYPLYGVLMMAGMVGGWWLERDYGMSDARLRLTLVICLYSAFASGPLCSVLAHPRPLRASVFMKAYICFTSALVGFVIGLALASL